jgi:hypothetical protein
MPRVEFEPTTPALERAKTVHALDRAATVIGTMDYCRPIHQSGTIRAGRLTLQVGPTHNTGFRFTAALVRKRTVYFHPTSPNRIMCLALWPHTTHP